MAHLDQNLEEFVHELTMHQDDLFFFIRALCGDPESAADIRQSVNIILWKKRAQFKIGTSFKSWAFRVAQFEVKAFLRKKKREGLYPFDADLLDLFAEEVQDFSDELLERKRALGECLKGLTEKDAELLRYRYWQSGSLDRFAEATGRSVGTLKARLFQLRARLRRCILSRLEGMA